MTWSSMRTAGWTRPQPSAGDRVRAKRDKLRRSEPIREEPMIGAIAAFAILVVAWLSVASAFAADKLKVAIGQREIWHGSPASLGARAGIFQRHGIELEVLYTEGAGQT